MTTIAGLPRACAQLPVLIRVLAEILIAPTVQEEELFTGPRITGFVYGKIDMRKSNSPLLESRERNAQVCHVHRKEKPSQIPTES